ncbi:hypothetical protein [Arthrobacter celericrescens]|uniref:sunset domain-containing protein n=1 Tax=Arthrobacter celericrescens TaxID=2320851 RepID=UPI001968CF9C|nr:hypothetical protein [Arthrobacter celericrescens]
MRAVSWRRKALGTLLALAAFAAPAVVVATSAQAAPTVTTRVASFSAGPATVVRGKAITVQGQMQGFNGRTWVKTGTVTAVVYFDPDGAKPNAAVRTLKTNTTGYFRTAFAASVTGKWSVRMTPGGALKGSASGQATVRVAAPAPAPTSARPVSTWNCPAWAPIKGNAPSKIYHLPGQRYYTRTTPEVCFATERAAQQAGYRKAKV